MIEQAYGVVPPLAVIVPEYTTSTVPFGSAPVIESGAGEITIVSLWVAFCAGLPESVTFTVTGDDPAAVGVPPIVQPLSDRPAGSVPVIEQLYEGVPSDAVIVELYATPTVPFGNVLVIVSAAGAIRIVSFWLAF